MKEENIKSLRGLGKTCHHSGLLPIFLGMLILFIGVVNKFTPTILVGLLIFIMGYAFVKIGTKIEAILNSEE